MWERLPRARHRGHCHGQRCWPRTSWWQRIQGWTVQVVAAGSAGALRQEGISLGASVTPVFSLHCSGSFCLDHHISVLRVQAQWVLSCSHRAAGTTVTGHPSNRSQDSDSRVAGQGSPLASHYTGLSNLVACSPRAGNGHSLGSDPMALPCPYHWKPFAKFSSRSPGEGIACGLGARAFLEVCGLGARALLERCQCGGGQECTKCSLKIRSAEPLTPGRPKARRDG